MAKRNTLAMQNVALIYGNLAWPGSIHLINAYCEFLQTQFELHFSFSTLPLISVRYQDNLWMRELTDDTTPIHDLKDDWLRRLSKNNEVLQKQTQRTRT